MSQPWLHHIPKLRTYTVRLKGFLPFINTPWISQITRTNYFPICDYSLHSHLSKARAVVQTNKSDRTSTWTTISHHVCPSERFGYIWCKRNVLSSSHWLTWVRNTSTLTRYLLIAGCPPTLCLPNRKDKKQCAALHVAVTDLKLKGVFDYYFVTYWRSAVGPRYATQTEAVVKQVTWGRPGYSHALLS